MTALTIEHHFRIDLTKGTFQHRLPQPLMHQDARADTFIAVLRRRMEPADLTGATVHGYMTRADRAPSLIIAPEMAEDTMLLTGDISGSTIILTLPEACYAHPGFFTLVLQVCQGDVRHTVMHLTGEIAPTVSDTITDPDHYLPDVPGLVAEIDELRAVKAEANIAADNAREAADAAYAQAETAEAAGETARLAAAEAREMAQRAEEQAGNASTAAQHADWAAADANRAAGEADEASAAARAAAIAAEDASDAANAAEAARQAAEIRREAALDGLSFAVEDADESVSLAHETSTDVATDESLKKLVTSVQRQTALLGLLAEDRRAATYESLAQVARIIGAGTVESNAALFPVGDQLIIRWMDMDDASHSTPETAYEVPLDILRHGMFRSEGGEMRPGMLVQWHHAAPLGMQFSRQQAFLKCADGLAAGTYHVTFGATWGKAKANASWSFKLTKAVPAGGLLSGFENMDTAATTTWKVKSWATADAASPIETVSVTSGATGTSLGTMQLATVSATGLNGMHQTGCGSNRWADSALSQWLNGAGTGWWQAQTDYDLRPEQYARHGFLSGFTPEDLSAFRKVQVTTAVSAAAGDGETQTETFDTFFPLSLAEMNVQPQAANVAEGETCPYWQERMGSPTAVARLQTYPELVTTALHAPQTPVFVMLRSTSQTTGSGLWHIRSSGVVNINNPCAGVYTAPTGVIGL